MKIIALSILLSVFCFKAFGQVKEQLPTIYINQQVSTHFIFSEPIQYVDLSSQVVQGDLPMENILRLKPVAKDCTDYGIVTIVAEKYMQQYQLVYSKASKADATVKVATGKNILNPAISLSTTEIKEFCLQILKQKRRKPVVRAKAYGLKLQLNQVYSIGDYFFMDVTIKNKTNIPYTIDQWQFSIQDKKISKATNVQSMPIEPVFQLYPTVDQFKNRYRNVLVFRKFTYPEEKIFKLRLTEKQYSGRTIDLEVKYQKLLKADTF